jgi:O-antigen/teichoic acid export membrane protein
MSGVLGKNIILGTLLTLFNMGFPLLTLLIIADRLSPDSIGELFFIESLGRIFSILFSLGIPVYGVRELSKVISRSQRDLILVELIILLSASTFFLFLIYFLLFHIFNDNLNINESINSYSILLLFYTISNIFQLDWLYQAEKKFKFLTWRTFIIKSLGLLLILILVKDDGDKAKFFFLISLTIGISAITNLTYSSISKIRIKQINLRRHLSSMKDFYITSISNNLYLTADVIIVSATSGNYALGIYSLAVRVARMPAYLVSGLTFVTQSEFSKSFCQKNELRGLTESNLNFILIVLIPFVVLFAINSKTIVYIISNPEFYDSAYIIITLSPLAILLTVNYVLNQQFLVNVKDEGLVRQIQIVALVVFIILTSTLSYIIGALGAAISILGYEIGLLIYTIFIIMKRHNISFYIDYKEMLLYSLFLTLGLLGTNLIFENETIVLITYTIICTMILLLMQKFRFHNELLKKLLPKNW